MVARIHPDRALTDAEKARRHRDRYAEYVRSLERAIVEIAGNRNRWDLWTMKHAPTIHRAREALSKDR
jgi:hypothetical protein